ncbi:hypothetical protein AMTR_s00027p00141660 [Amborella trichopoda]|uniref:Uncharacterized protein n=1 Tax=Amborella trichopoda TaxID=13333 RepID=W1PL70_AMBTC|nr:hypothetical protein AMTR_s00027p00141660 [Amborella trichopoda]
MSSDMYGQRFGALSKCVDTQHSKRSRVLTIEVLCTSASSGCELPEKEVWTQQSVEADEEDQVDPDGDFWGIRSFCGLFLANLH